MGRPTGKVNLYFYAGLSTNVLRFRGPPFDFSTQFVDDDANNLWSIKFSPPHSLKQIFVSYRLALSQDQNLEHFKFLWSQVNLLPANDNEPSFKVHAKVRSVHNVGWLVAATPEQRTYSREQFLPTVRF